MGASGNGAATRVLVIWAELKRSGTTVVSKQAIDGRARVCCCSRIASTRSRPSVQRALHTAHSTGSPLPHLHPVETHFRLIQRRALPRTRCHQHVETDVPGEDRVPWNPKRRLALLALQLLLGAAVKMTLQ